MTATANWPAQGDYRDALQNIDVAFRDPELRRCSVERNRMGVPRARSGAFASVYKLIKPNGQAVALKLFNFANDERQARYELVSEHLRKLGTRRPTCLVHFEYQREGIRIQGRWYPTQTMAWVTGQSLGQWLRDRMLAQETERVRQLADSWVRICEGLRAVKIAHGDLQHDNIMVADNQLLLVDYDGMCVPGLEGQPQHEYGKPAYQHPKRAQHALSLDLDAFSSWIILVALRACAADPKLYQKYVEKAENENILFSERDLKEPSRTQLWGELARSPDSDVRDWSAQLREMLKDGFPFTRIPALSLDPHKRLTELAQATPCDWEQLFGEAERLRSAGKSLPSEPKLIVLRIQEAARRIAARDHLKKLLQAQTISSLKSFADWALLRDWPQVKPLVQSAEQFLARADTIQQLQTASQKDDLTLLRVWQSLPPATRGWDELEPFRQKLERYSLGLAALDKYRKVLPQAAESAIASAWQEVERANGSLLASQEERARGELAVRRITKLPKLRGIPLEPSESTDRALLATWDPALEDLPEAQVYKPRILEARARLKIVANLMAVNQRVEQGLTPVSTLLTLARDLPDNYLYNLLPKVNQARERHHAVTQLQALLQQSPRSITAISKAWQKFGELIPAHDPIRKECETLLKQLSTLQVVKKQIATAKDEYREDVRLYEMFKQHHEMLDPLPEYGPLKGRVELARTRLKAWSALYKALQARDVPKILRLAALPMLQNYPPMLEYREQITSYQQLLEWMTDLSERLKEANLGQGLPLTLLDLERLRHHHELFEPKFREALAKLVSKRLSEVIELERGIVPFYELPGSRNLFKLSWTWNRNPIVSSFFLAIKNRGPWLSMDQVPAEQSATCRLTDYQHDGNGRIVVLERPKDVWVSVWPIVNLGWTSVPGNPLHFGPITQAG